MAYDAWQAPQGSPYTPTVPKPDARQTGQQPRSAYYEYPARLYWGQLTGSDAALYTAPSAPTTGPAPKVRITEIVIANTDTSARTVTLEIRTGASAAATQILPAVTFAANSVTVMEMDTVLEAAEIISGLASTASKVNVRISGVVLLTLPTS